MQVVEVSVRDQDHVNGRQIADEQARPAQALQHEEPAGKIRINHDIQSANLHEKRRVADEREAQLAVARQHRFVGLAGPGCDDGVTNEAGKLTGPFPEGRM